MHVERRETKIQRKGESRQETKNVICHVPSLTVHFLLVFFLWNRFFPQFLPIISVLRYSLGFDFWLLAVSFETVLLMEGC